MDAKAGSGDESRSPAGPISANLPAELVGQLNGQPLQPDEFTATMVIEQTDGRKRTVQEHLGRLVQDGRLTRRKVKIGGVWHWAYKEVSASEPAVSKVRRSKGR